MRGPLTTFALWLGATALAVGVGLSATNLVAGRVTGPPSGIAIDLVQEGAAPGETRTVTSVGGSAALRFAGDLVEVLWATPSAGFTADVEDDTGQGEARVDFRSPDHRSRIKGEWRDGSPTVEVEERPDD